MALEDLIDAAKDAHLRYISEASKGISRKKDGKEFKYFDEDGKTVKDEKIIERINKMAIPPAWKDVWISPHRNTHLQATGLDDKGRKQYIYHPEWILITQQNKFDKLTDFALTLPKIRSRLKYDLEGKVLDQKKVIATVIWLLENTFIRVGNEEYAKENNSFGLTTLRSRHVNVRGNQIKFQFKGKSGVMHAVSVTNPKVVKTIKQCIELPGYEIFQYLDESGERHVVDSKDVNEYLSDTTNQDISAKDFRTWGGTVLSAVTLKQLGDFENQKQAAQNISEAVKTVCSHLRNTATVCRNYYIHPTIISTYTKKILVPHFLKTTTNSNPGLLSDEYKTLTLLQKY